MLQEFTYQHIGKADLMVYMTHDTYMEDKVPKGVIGIAFIGAVCKGKDDSILKQSINEWQPTAVQFAGVSFISILTDFCNILFSIESHYIKILFMEYNCTQSSDIKD